LRDPGSRGQTWTAGTPLGYTFASQCAPWLVIGHGFPDTALALAKQEIAPDYSTYVKEDELYHDPEVYLRMFCLWSRTFKELLNVMVCIVVISLYIDTRSSKLMKY
jgi:hypothetical protein